ncbi:putative ribonuclease H-like domain-containing protein [Medicago truncatula]|uniref:Putative ribonuclease H-like domain-containing protein n=1 Tax=Medicago truncatula TaxID=3880 RepID=A0A396J6M3_MEDTR|nr:putative ribonuclease H-like domain-containing protein [Medicago truncatula]
MLFEPFYPRWKSEDEDLVRDSEGFSLVAASWNFEALPDATIVEALRFRLAIQFSYDMGFRNIIVEGDSLIVVKALKAHSNDNSYFGLVINDCKSLSCLFSSFLVSHVRRGGNSIAHALAKFALDSTDFVWIKEIPSCITFVVATDLVHI